MSDFKIFNMNLGFRTFQSVRIWRVSCWNRIQNKLFRLQNTCTKLSLHNYCEDHHNGRENLFYSGLRFESSLWFVGYRVYPLPDGVGNATLPIRWGKRVSLRGTFSKFVHLYHTVYLSTYICRIADFPVNILSNTQPYRIYNCTCLLYIYFRPR